MSFFHIYHLSLCPLLMYRHTKHRCVCVRSNKHLWRFPDAVNFLHVQDFLAVTKKLGRICRFPSVWNASWLLLFVVIFLFPDPFPNLTVWLPGRRLDLHGADGHLPRQVLQASDREGHEHPRGHPGKDRRLCGFGCTMWTMKYSFPVTYFLWTLSWC